MNRILSVAILALGVSVAMLTPGVASARAKAHHRHVTVASAASTTCPVSDPSKCPASCRPHSAASATSASAASHGAGAMTAGTCPVSDPSKCPAWCRPSTGTTATNAATATTAATASAVKH